MLKNTFSVLEVVRLAYLNQTPCIKLGAKLVKRLTSIFLISGGE